MTLAPASGCGSKLPTKAYVNRSGHIASNLLIHAYIGSVALAQTTFPSLRSMDSWTNENEMKDHHLRLDKIATRDYNFFRVYLKPWRPS